MLVVVMVIAVQQQHRPRKLIDVRYRRLIVAHDS
jgi:hypothetical protein